MSVRYLCRMLLAFSIDVIFEGAPISLDKNVLH